MSCFAPIKEHCISRTDVRFTQHHGRNFVRFLVLIGLSFLSRSFLPEWRSSAEGVMRILAPRGNRLIGGVHRKSGLYVTMRRAGNDNCVSLSLQNQSTTDAKDAATPTTLCHTTGWRNVIGAECKRLVCGRLDECRFHIGAVDVKVQQNFDVNVKINLMPNWWASKHGPDHSLTLSKRS